METCLLSKSAVMRIRKMMMYIGIIFVMPLVLWSNVFASETSLMMVSDRDDFVGGGYLYFYSSASGDFSAQKSSDNTVSIVFFTNNYDQFWELDFTAPDNALLTVGTYPDATSSPVRDADEPGMSIYGDGRACDSSTGNFDVKEIKYGAGRRIISFWATFEQHCGSGRFALRGEIRFNADTPNTSTAIGTSTDASPSIVGQPVELTAAVASNAGAPTGTVQFKEGSTVLGVSTLSAVTSELSVATLNISSLPVGIHTIKALYTGNKILSPSGSESVDISIVKSGNTLLMLNHDPQTAFGGDWYNFYSLSDALFIAWKDFNDLHKGLGIRVRLNNGENDWGLFFAAPDNELLSAGTYSTAEIYSYESAGKAGMEIHDAFYTGCSGTVNNRFAGSFEVKKITYGPANSIRSFWATFEQRCNGGPSALRGEIRYNVAAPDTVTSLRTSANPAVVGQPLTFISTVNGFGGIPTGTVTFKAGSKVLGKASLTGNPATATFTTSALSPKLYAVTAVYSGDSRFESSTSAIVKQTIEKQGATLIIANSDKGDFIGQGLFHAYSLKDGAFDVYGHKDFVHIYFNTPYDRHTWNLNFLAPFDKVLTPGIYAGAIRDNYGLDKPGLDISADASGCNTVKGSFEVKEIAFGAYNRVKSFWATFVQHCEGVSQALRGEIRFRADVPETMTTIVASATSVILGQPVKFTAKVTGASGTPTGKVIFVDGSLTDGAQVIGTGILAGDTATVSITKSSLTAGQHSVQAVYMGDANFASSISSLLTLKVSKAGANPDIILP